jgi:hypothetical protein
MVLSMQPEETRYEQAKGHKERYQEETCEGPDGKARRKEGKESQSRLSNLKDRSETAPRAGGRALSGCQCEGTLRASVFQRKDGKWMIFRDTWNSDAAPTK